MVPVFGVFSVWYCGYILCLSALCCVCTRYLFLSLCRYVLRCQLFFKQGAENQAGERSAVEHLPEKCHRQVTAKGVRPCAEAGLLEQQGSDETHDRAHDADDHQGNRGGLLKYTA